MFYYRLFIITVLALGTHQYSFAENQIQSFKQGQTLTVRQSEYQDLREWCRRSASQLRRALMRARRSYNTSQFEEAKQILKLTYRKVSNSLNLPSGSVSPITKRMVDRGLRYITEIEDVNKRHPTSADLYTEMLFLDKYTELIIEVESYLDQKFYIPYSYYDCMGCQYDFEEFARRYMKVAYKELNFIQKTFILKNENRHGYRYLPKGNQYSFLKLTELSARNVARDIASTLYRYQNACLVLRLEDLEHDLSIYWTDQNPVDAFQYAATELEDILINLYQQLRSTRSSNHRDRSPKFDVCYYKGGF